MSETVNSTTKYVWEHHATFDTEDEATAYLTNLMKVTA